MKRLIIYDLDGTLVDTLTDITQAVNHMLRQMGSPELSAQEIRRYIGSGIHELIRRCLKTEDPQDIERGEAIYSTYYAQHFLDQSCLYPGAAAALQHFRTRYQAVVTNKPNPYSREILTALGVAGHFLDIVAGDSEFPRKPDPASMLAIVQKVGTTPQDTLLIGDSPIDVEAGRNAGILTVGVLHGFSDADELAAAGVEMMVRDFDELLEQAKRRAW